MAFQHTALLAVLDPGPRDALDDLQSLFPGTPAGAAGSAILAIDSKLQTCDMAGTFPIKIWSTCKSWSQATPTLSLKLELEVAGDCSINIRPITDKTCSDPGAVEAALALFPRTASANGLDGQSKYTYTYNDLKIRAYYTAADKIRTLLPSTSGGARCMGCMLGRWFGLWCCVPVAYLMVLASDAAPTAPPLGAALPCSTLTSTPNPPRSN